MNAHCVRKPNSLRSAKTEGMNARFARKEINCSLRSQDNSLRGAKTEDMNARFAREDMNARFARFARPPTRCLCHDIPRMVQ
jgi:hypothetical protein